MNTVAVTTTYAPGQRRRARTACVWLLATVIAAGGAGIQPAPRSAAAAGPRPGQILYTATWSAGLAGWNASADWNVRDGILANDGTLRGWSVLFAPYRPTVPNYAVIVEMQIITGGDSRGVVVHGSAAGHLKVGTDRGYGAEIADASNTPATHVPYNPGHGWHTYQVDVAGRTVTLTIDGRPLVQTTDTRATFGQQLGLWDGGGARVEIRSFMVMATNGVSPPVTGASGTPAGSAPPSGSVTSSGAPGECTNDLLRQAITWVAQRAPKGTGEQGECNDALYMITPTTHVTSASSWDDILYAVARHFLSSRYPRSLGILVQHMARQRQQEAARLTLAQLAARCGGLPVQSTFAHYAEGRFVALINADRHARGLPPLAIKHDLTVVSRILSARDLHDAESASYMPGCLPPTAYLQHGFSAAASQGFYATHCYASDARLLKVERELAAQRGAGGNVFSTAYDTIGVGAYMLPPSRPGWNLFVTITLGTTRAPGAATTFTVRGW